MTRTFVAGPNFSGRSEAVVALARGRAPDRAFFIGPYAEAALSGLSSNVADELTLYRHAPAVAGVPAFDIAAFANRRPQSLSGGEQVLLALHCFSTSGFKTIAIDTALEQLDAGHRATALSFLDGIGDPTFNAILADNRIDDAPPGWTVMHPATPSAMMLPCDPVALASALPALKAPTIAIDDLSFAYRRGRPIFERAQAQLSPGIAYRLMGRNGVGKTTLLRLLAGVLKPRHGMLVRDGTRYAPWREGNALIALATQNPDYQWCGVTLREDLSRRLRALPDRPAIDEVQMTQCAARLGIASLDQHLYELPLTARKRLGWLWPLMGLMPWIVLDEPTIGQDRATRLALAQTITLLCERGYGLIVVTHDDDFAERFAHQTLTLRDGKIAQ